MKTTIFVGITIAALGVVGVTTSIMSSGISAYAQTTMTKTGHDILCGAGSSGTSCLSGRSTVTTNPNTGQFSGSFSGSLSGIGGGKTSTSGNVITGQFSCSHVGSPGFKAATCPSG